MSDKEFDEKLNSIDPNGELKKYPIQEKAYNNFIRKRSLQK